MRYSIDDYLFFEKIRRQKRKELTKEEKLFSREELDLLQSQIFGSIHLVDDRKIPGFYIDKFYRNDLYSKKSKIRPGVVITPPSAETNYETEWAPMSSNLHNRNPLITVFLKSGVEKVIVDSVILLIYRNWYKFKTLSERKGKLSPKKQEELKQKLNYLKKIEALKQNE